MKKVKNILLKILKEKIAYAHCDIPCGIYDPHNAQLSAHTVIRMTQFLNELKKENEVKTAHNVSRITHVKEEHSSLLEEELMTLKNDYFKPEMVERYPELDNLFKKALQTSGKARTGIDMDAAEQTLETVMQIAEIFYKSKGLESQRVKAPYPTGLDIVVQK